jgi:hypothetical protein
MYYSATIVEMAGLSSSRTTNIWIAVAINAVNFLFSFPGEQITSETILKVVFAILLRTQSFLGALKRNILECKRYFSYC